MTKEQLRHHIRNQVRDLNSKAYFLSDDDMDLYIKEAEREAAERAGLFKIDRTLAMTANRATYTLDNVIELTRIKVSGASKPLTKTTKRELDFEIGAWDAQPASTPKYYFRVDDAITLYPTPSTSGTLLLDGTRYADYDLETPESLHESLGDWVIFRFYTIEDADMYDPPKAQFFDDRFSRVFGKKKNQQFMQAWRNGSPSSSMHTHEF